MGPQGQVVNGNASSDVALPQPPPPPLILDMSLSMWIDSNGDNVGDAGGDLIQFGFTLTNHSGDTLHGITITDSLGVAVGSLQTQPPASLAPNDFWPSTYNYFLNATDAINNHVSDTVTITALDSQNHTLSVTAFWDQIFP